MAIIDVVNVNGRNLCRHCGHSAVAGSNGEPEHAHTARVQCRSTEVARHQAGEDQTSPLPVRPEVEEPYEPEVPCVDYPHCRDEATITDQLGSEWCPKHAAWAYGED